MNQDIHRDHLHMSMISDIQKLLVSADGRDAASALSRKPSRVEAAQRDVYRSCRHT